MRVRVGGRKIKQKHFLVFQMLYHVLQGFIFLFLIFGGKSDTRTQVLKLRNTIIGETVDQGLFLYIPAILSASLNNLTVMHKTSSAQLDLVGFILHKSSHKFLIRPKFFGKLVLYQDSFGLNFSLLQFWTQIFLFDQTDFHKTMCSRAINFNFVLN